MTIAEAEQEIRRLKQWIEDERDRIRAAREVTVVDAFNEKKRLCAIAAANTGLDAWDIESKKMSGRYPKIRSLVYWKMAKMGYDGPTIAKAFGRRTDISATVSYVDARLRANRRMLDAAERIFET